MSSIKTLKERIETYEQTSDYRLLSTIPKVIVIDGKNTKKFSSLLNKPFSDQFLELMCATTIRLMSEIDGTILGYTYNDIIIIAANNNSFEDQWYNGNIQKIVSASSSIATIEFNKLAKEREIELLGDALFTAQTYSIPNITELTNLFIGKQNAAFHSALYMACFHELLKRKHDPDTIRQTIMDKTAGAKAELLFDSTGIEFNNYPLHFVRGVGCYRAPKIMNIDGVDKIKHKLYIDMELPIFAKDQEFLRTIFRSGHDIFRA
jgi:tRNA(His) 5'-end guanylyltransferase